MWRSHVIALLNAHYERAKRKNPRYSRRSFAQKLDLSAGALSEILSGKRKISASRAIKILKCIGLTEEELAPLTVLMGLRDKVPTADLRSNQYQFLSSWRHWALLSLIELDERLDAQTVARRLKMALADVHAVIADLERLGLVKQGPEGPIRTEEHLITSDGPSDERIRAHHLSSQELTALAIKHIRAPERDSTSITFTATPRQFQILRDEIRALLEKIAAVSAASPKEQSYHISINFFPLDFQGKK